MRRDPAGPGEIGRIEAAVYGLSPREREVSDPVFRGASTKQISASLRISEYTVRDHLSNAFFKAGRRCRGELVKRPYLGNV
ncbi:hypothetical protein GBA65_20870 [Rubrobacter marinus]|uniref:HTH luxR-type domain-containing protein n=1 Tax=Rubrobacter marinus TaxID=2653852 RepID=A0A6G8Q244_9ACTN|nr:helix-turn-helix transcriptional regulator [Rubrobacter marinus]QIN80554.1 hypothetical protein GBA65_20870 [Rubrobacter marinus]